jgi:hypothetical protein
MTNYKKTEAIESLAAEIGENIYIDVAKWHLYLSNAHLHTIVAEKVYPLLENHSVNESAVTKILDDILVELAGGKSKISLRQLLPAQCQQNLLDILEEFAGNL